MPNESRGTPLSVQDAQVTAKLDVVLQKLAIEQLTALAKTWPERTAVQLDFRDLDLADPELGDYLLERPRHVLRIASTAMHQRLAELGASKGPAPQLRVHNLPPTEHIGVRQIRHDRLGQLVTVDCILRKASGVRAKVLEAVFECKVCTTRMPVIQEEGPLQKPVLCETCDAERPWRFLESDSRWINLQHLQFEEIPDGLDVPSQPQRITAIATADDVIQDLKALEKVGERLRIVAIVGLKPPKNEKEQPAEFEYRLQIVDARSLDEDDKSLIVTPEDEASFRAAVQDVAHLEKLRGSVAPGLFGLEHEKIAVLAAIFAGVEKFTPDHMRGSIHVLLVGDPSTGKSQLLKAAKRLAPRAVFTSGKGVSAAGLTASVNKDDFDGRWALEAGALPMADRGIACIDELDKMDREDQSGLHQAMEQQEISINKAGISATLKARTTVLGAANPKLGRFDTMSPLMDQVDLTPPLISRFDLIFTIAERANKERDKLLAKFVFSKHRLVSKAAQAIFGQPDQLLPKEPIVQSLTPPYAEAWMRKFIRFAQANYSPAFTDAAEMILTEYYLIMRDPTDDVVAIVTRQLEGLIRLSEAFAKMRLSAIVEEVDARHALELHNEYMRRVGTDKTTGKFDVDLVNGGIARSQHDRMMKTLEIVRELAKLNEKGFAREDDVVAEAGRRLGLTPGEVAKTLEGLAKHFVYNKAGKGTWAPLS